MDIKIDVLDYLGKFENGVMTLISIGLDDKYFEASFFYTEEMIAITPEEAFEKEIESSIEDWKHYDELVLSVLKKVVPYNEIINRLDEFDPKKYNLYLEKDN